MAGGHSLALTHRRKAKKMVATVYCESTPVVGERRLIIEERVLQNSHLCFSLFSVRTINGFGLPGSDWVGFWLGSLDFDAGVVNTLGRDLVNNIQQLFDEYVWDQLDKMPMTREEGSGSCVR